MMAAGNKAAFSMAGRPLAAAEEILNHGAIVKAGMIPALREAERYETAELLEDRAREQTLARFGHLARRT